MGSGNLFSNVDPTVFNAILHSFQMILIWLRFMSVMITSKNIGPFLRMIYLMMKEVVNFFLIFMVFLLCSAAIFTALFTSANEGYVDFETSIRTLFSSALANFDLTTFTDYLALGAFILAIYLLIGNVMLLNLLIAILSNVYAEINVRVDSEHRAVVVSYYNRWYWNY